jgi:hypothetical protein
VQKRLPGNGTRIETRPGGSRKALEQIRSGHVNVLGFQDQIIIPDPKQLHRTLDMMSGKTVKIQVSLWTAYIALCTMRTSFPNINKSPCYRWETYLCLILCLQGKSLKAIIQEATDITTIRIVQSSFFGIKGNLIKLTTRLSLAIYAGQTV